MSARPVLCVAVGAGPEAARPWVEALRAHLPGLDVREIGDVADPAAVRYVAAWKHRPGALAAFGNAGAIVSLGAGVDRLLADPTLPAHVPVVRVVDPDLTARMSEWVMLHVLLHHRQAARYARQQAERRWEDDPHQPAARAVRVGVMGLGTLGADAATKLALMGFDVAGWSRTPKTLPGVAVHVGEAARDAFLARTQVLVVLLPLTSETHGILDARLFARLARDGHGRGPVVLNAGRGGLQDEADIVRCLDDGTLGAVTLDVFAAEPLPRASPLWGHPGVTVTPHNAAISNPDAVAGFVARAIAGYERGEASPHEVDRARGY